MPSTNKTPNLDLNAWIGTDIPQRDDFVSDNQKIDDYAGRIDAEFVKLSEDKAEVYPEQNIVLLNGITQGFPASDTCKAVRVGNMVSLQVVGVVIPSNLPINTIVFYLDEEHRPGKNCTLNMVSNENTLIRLSLYANGQVQIKTNSIPSGTYHIVGSFPV